MSKKNLVNLHRKAQTSDKKDRQNPEATEIDCQNLST